MAAPVGGPLIGALRRHEQVVVHGVTALVVAVLVLAPLAALGLTLAPRVDLAPLAQSRTWLLLARSLGLSLAVTAVAFAAGVPLGVIVGRSEVPLRRVLWLLHAVPMALPPLLPALGWARAVAACGSDTATRLLFGPVGLVVVLGLTFAPIVTSLTALGVSGIDASIEESARLVASPWRVITRILLPLARPALALAAVLVFVLALSEVGVPMFLRVDVYASSVFARLGGVGASAHEALALSTPLLVVAAALVALERRFAGERSFAVLGLGRTRVSRPLRHRGGLALAVVVLGAAISVLPIGALALTAAGPGGGLAALAWAGDAPLNGLICAALGATIITALGIVLGHASARRLRGARLIDGACVLAFIVPAAVTGVGIVLVWNRPVTAFAYRSLAIVVVGYVARYAIIGARVIAATVSQTPPSLEEAAAASGARFSRRLLRLVAPAHRGGLVFAWLAALVFCLRDLETVVLFYPPGGESLPVRIFTLEANGPPAVVASLCMLHILLTLAAVALVAVATRRRVT